MNERLPLLPLVLTLGALLACSAAARGDHLPKWELGVGAAALHLPDYRGSDQSRGYLAPYPYLVYRGERIRVSEEGLRGMLFETDRVALDLSLDAAVPVNSEDNEARQGMPDLDPTVEIGPSLKIRLSEQPAALGSWDLHLPLRAVIATDLRHSQSAGWTFNPSLVYARRIPFPRGRLRLAFSLGPIWSTQAHHDYYYSVDPAYATPTRPAYRAAGGYSGLRLLATFGKRLNSRLLLGGFLRYDDLHNAAFEESPLLREKATWMAGLALTWVLSHSDIMVEHEK
ncbi:MAG: hypothetical protein Kow006_03260 [Gammaproteobacteria bacterium]